MTLTHYLWTEVLEFMDSMGCTYITRWVLLEQQTVMLPVVMKHYNQVKRMRSQGLFSLQHLPEEQLELIK